MYVLDVIPLSRTAPGVLSYRSRTELPIGSIVDIILRKTSTQGIVVACLPVADAKEMLKHARFLLSKSAPSAFGILPDALMRAAEDVALWHAASVGAVLAALFAEYIRSDAQLPASTFGTGTGFSETGVDAPVTDRVQKYADVIDAALASGSSALLVVATIAESTYWKGVFSKYKPLVVSGAASGARRKTLLESAAAHQGLVITTPSFSWTPIASLGCIIVDRISAGTHTLPKRPYICIPRSVRSLACERKIPIVYGDFPLPLEYQDDTSDSRSAASNVQLIDMRKDPDEQKDVDGPWSILPEDVIEKIGEECASGGRVVVLASRAGYSPAVVCRDCGQALSDERGMPFSFSTANGKRIFRTRDGKSILDARMKCPRCDSWNLLPLGVGQERVIEELKNHFHDAFTIVDASSERLRTPAGAKNVFAQGAAPGSIIVGGEALLPWLLLHADTSEKRPLGVIASADSLLSLPFWRSRERFLRLSYFFSSLCSEIMLLSRRPEDTAAAAATGKRVDAFWDEERSFRKTLGYPPYGTLMTCTAEGSADAIGRSLEPVVLLLGEFNPQQIADVSAGPNSVRRTIVATLPEGVWPDTILSQELQHLPPHIRVRIDPDSIW